MFKSFLLKWFLRLKILSLLFALWAIIFSINTVLKSNIAFEYEDGLVYCRNSYIKTKKDLNLNEVIDKTSFLKEQNKNCNLDQIKPISFLIAYFFKFLGFKIDLILDRGAENTSCIENRFSNLINKFYFVENSQEKFLKLQDNNYLFFFASSDDGIIQAQKMNIKPIRIQRNKKSSSFLDYNIKKFNETIIPLSYF